MASVLTIVATVVTTSVYDTFAAVVSGCARCPVIVFGVLARIMLVCVVATFTVDVFRIVLSAMFAFNNIVFIVITCVMIIYVVCMG